MNIYNKILKKYFKPKECEFYGRGSVYTLIGIKYFKKYLPTSGDVIRKYSGVQLIKFTSKDRFSELYKYELKTRSLELRHIIGMIFFITLAIIIKKNYSLFDYFLVPILFLAINIYPIMLQRHNRIRIIKLLEKFGKPSPY